MVSVSSAHGGVPNTADQEADAIWPDVASPDELAERGYYPIHAAAFENARGIGLLLPAPSQSGKTTFTLLAAQLGRRVAADDIVLLREERGTLQGWPYFPFSLVRESDGRLRISLLSERRRCYPIVVDQIVFPRLVNGQMRLRSCTETPVWDRLAMLVRQLIWPQESRFRDSLKSILKSLMQRRAWILDISQHNTSAFAEAMVLLDDLPT